MVLGDLDIIGDVTRTLSDVLTGLDVTHDSPAALVGGNGNFKKLNLYLYQVTENAHMKNQPWVTTKNDTLEYPPLAINLYYLLTPYASDALTAHQVLTYTMQKFHDNSYLVDEQLEDSLRLTIDHLTIELCSMELEELTRIWNALQTPYRLSVVYEVHIALISSEKQRKPKRVKKKIDVYEQI